MAELTRETTGEIIGKLDIVTNTIDVAWANDLADYEDQIVEHNPLGEDLLQAINLRELGGLTVTFANMLYSPSAIRQAQNPDNFIINLAFADDAYWIGGSQIMFADLEHHGQLYGPNATNKAWLREWALPPQAFVKPVEPAALQDVNKQGQVKFFRQATAP